MKLSTKLESMILLNCRTIVSANIKPFEVHITIVLHNVYLLVDNRKCLR